jgi:hypothetical protein
VTFQTWGRPDNLPAIPNGKATAVAATLASPGKATSERAGSRQDAQQQSRPEPKATDVPFTRLAGPFALTATETIKQAIGDVAADSNAATAAVSSLNSAAVAAAAVPEPSSMLLLGTGVLGLFYWRRKSV